VIPEDFITEWRTTARWANDAQVEQDLVLSRALVEIFGDPLLAGALALRGGTALHKLHFSPARRYSEDIDLVQLDAGPFGPLMDRLRARLDPWLGSPTRDPGRLVYRFDSEIAPVVRMRLKIETNTREHFSLHGTTKTPFAVESRWWRGAAEVTGFRIDELLGTKLRALYQRKKGRDLFDLCLGLDAGVDPRAIVAAFRRYMEAERLAVSRAEFERNLDAKRRLRGFASDVAVLLPPGAEFDVAAGIDRVEREIVGLLAGAPWKRPPRSGDRE
jgi:predicted nucleotidyltransferase component of viral defense system